MRPVGRPACRRRREIPAGVGRLSCRRRDLHPMRFAASASQTPYDRKGKKPGTHAIWRESSPAVRHVTAAMKPAFALLALLLAATVALAAEGDSRFSQVLSAAERTEIGLE